MRPPEPYYDEGGITIYHGDCREILPNIDPDHVALVLTDPPYGIEWTPPTHTTEAVAVNSTHSTAFVIGDDRPFDLSSLERFQRLIVWGANYWQHPPGGLIVWDKTGGGKASTFMPGAEVAWSNIFSGCHIFHHLWQGAFRDYVDDEWKAHNRGLHPTQKPTRLMRWIVERWTNPDDLVLDPYMGSGPVGQACHELGRRYIGIEIERRYCEVAVQRLVQGVLEFG